MKRTFKPILAGLLHAHAARTLVHLLAQDAEQVLVLGAGSALSLPSDPSVELPDSIVWMPAGTHAINAHTVGGGTFSGKVHCDEQALRAVQASQKKIEATGRKVWLDFNHEEAAASAWVDHFSWDPARGILAHLKWTDEGAKALRGRAFRSFSPAFSCEKETGRVHGLLGADHSAGGLVNSQAFTAMPALIAARMSGFPPAQESNPGGNADNQNKMKTIAEVIALLAGLNVTPPADASLETLVALHAKTVGDIAAADLKKAADQAAAQVLATNNAAIEAAKVKAAADAVAVQAQAKADQEAKELAEFRAVFAAHRAGAAIAHCGPGIQSQKANPFEAIKAMMKEKDSVKRGRIYCDDLREFVAVTAHLAQVLADNSFGTVTSDLIVLRSLDLLKLRFPILSKISTDFSAGVVPMQGQAIKSRIVSIPSVVTYNTSTGWASSDAVTTDVPVTIGAPVGVQISLQNTEIGGSNRDLFAEQVEASHYALGKNMVDALYAVITQANFSGSEKRTIKALASMARATVIDIATALSKRGAGGEGFLLLNSDYYGAMSKDLVTVANSGLVNAAVQQSRVLPRIQDLDIIEASNLPAAAFTSTTGTLQGFGGRKDSLVIATRVPDDYTKALPGSSHGSVSVITNPDTGISVQKVDFVDHVLSRAYSRIAMSYGVAKGQVNSGQCLTET